MQTPCPISLQKHGLPLDNHEDHKTDYQLKSKSGRVVMVFTDEARAKEEAANRSLDCFRVTTFVEKL